MNALTLYLLEASVCLGVFYLFYLAVLHRQPTFQYNRVYLLAASVLGWVLPLLEVSLGTTGSRASSGVGAAYLLLSPAEAGGVSEASTGGWPFWLGLVYGGGLVVAAIYYGAQVYRLHQTVRSSREQVVPHRRYRLLYTDGRFPTASYFRFLFWDNTQPLTVEETRQMMLHEETHIRQGHSYDMVYLTLLKVFAWFHPLVYLYERALIQTHEYAADAGVLRQAPVAQRAYARLLSKHTLSSRNVLLVNRFFYPSFILNRINMIYETQKTPWYRYVLIVPVFASLFLTFACQPDEEEVTREAVAQSYEEVKSEIVKVDEEIQAIVNQYYPTQQQFIEAVDKYREQNQGQIDEMKILKGKLSSTEFTTLESLIARRDELRKKQAHLPDADGIYTVVENQPEPKNGISTFYKHIGDNIRYPKAARQAGIEGKVFVQFVVDKYGQLTAPKVLKGIGGGCDEEAVRVLQEAPEWIPGTTGGQAVNVRIVIPINFKLDRVDAPESLGKNSESDGLSATEEKSKIDEMVVVGY